MCPEVLFLQIILGSVRSPAHVSMLSLRGIGMCRQKAVHVLPAGCTPAVCGSALKAHARALHATFGRMQRLCSTSSGCRIQVGQLQALFCS